MDPTTYETTILIPWLADPAATSYKFFTGGQSPILTNDAILGGNLPQIFESTYRHTNSHYDEFLCANTQYTLYIPDLTQVGHKKFSYSVYAYNANQERGPIPATILLLEVLGTTKIIARLVQNLVVQESSDPSSLVYNNVYTGETVTRAKQDVLDFQNPPPGVTNSEDFETQYATVLQSSVLYTPSS